MELVRYFITSAEGGNVFTFICLSVCLFVRLSICEQPLFHELLPSVPNYPEVQSENRESILYVAEKERL